MINDSLSVLQRAAILQVKLTRRREPVGSVARCHSGESWRADQDNWRAVTTSFHEPLDAIRAAPDMIAGGGASTITQARN
jgi:hypothetical protein